MVKKIFKFIAYTTFFILAIIAFTPKSNAYFLLEKNLQKFGAVVSNETLEDKAFSLNIKHLQVSVKNIHAANIKEVNVMFLLLFNKIEFKDIELSSLVNSFVPSKINRVEISYMVFNPLFINIKANGRFGSAIVKINLLHRELKLFLKPSQTMVRNYQNTLRNFSKNKKGEYVYVKTF